MIWEHGQKLRFLWFDKQLEHSDEWKFWRFKITAAPFQCIHILALSVFAKTICEKFLRPGNDFAWHQNGRLSLRFRFVTTIVRVSLCKCLSSFNSQPENSNCICEINLFIALVIPNAKKITQNFVHISHVWQWSRTPTKKLVVCQEVVTRTCDFHLKQSQLSKPVKTHFKFHRQFCLDLTHDFQSAHF